VGDWLCSEVKCSDRRGECVGVGRPQGGGGDFGNNGDLEVKGFIFLLLFVLFSGFFGGCVWIYVVSSYSLI